MRTASINQIKLLLLEGNHDGMLALHVSSMFYPFWKRAIENDRILENHPYGRILYIKYLTLKSSLKILFSVQLWLQYSKMLWIIRKNVEIFKIYFCDVSKHPQTFSTRTSSLYMHKIVQLYLYRHVRYKAK